MYIMSFGIRSTSILVIFHSSFVHHPPPPRRLLEARQFAASICRDHAAPCRCTARFIKVIIPIPHVFPPKAAEANVVSHYSENSFISVEQFVFLVKTLTGAKIYPSFMDSQKVDCGAKRRRYIIDNM